MATLPLSIFHPMPIERIIMCEVRLVCIEYVYLLQLVGNPIRGNGVIKDLYMNKPSGKNKIILNYTQVSGSQNTCLEVIQCKIDSKLLAIGAVSPLASDARFDRLTTDFNARGPFSKPLTTFSATCVAVSAIEEGFPVDDR